MKKILILLLLQVIGVLGVCDLNAQVSFSTTYRQYCYWDDVFEEFSNCNGYNDNSLFVMNDNETMFTHITEYQTSTYYVKGKEYDAVNDLFQYDVVSDIGNSYFYIFDPKNKEIRVLFFDDDDDLVLLTFTVKAIF